MSNPSKQRGSAFERGIREYLRDQGLRVDHLKQSGANDIGDLYVHQANCVLELKALRKMDLATAVREAELEATHYADAHRLDVVPAFAAVLKATGKPLAEAYVVLPLHEWVRVNRPAASRHARVCSSLGLAACLCGYPGWPCGRGNAT